MVVLFICEAHVNDPALRSVDVSGYYGAGDS